MNHKDKTRDILQIMRAVAIIIVLVRHGIACVNTGAFLNGMEQIIICFHMPAFFIISGYLFEKKLSKYQQQGTVIFVKSKVMHLLVPYVFWTVLLWCGIQVGCMVGPLRTVLHSIGFDTMSIKHLLIGLLTYQYYYTQHLWFLYVLFVFFVISIFFGKQKVNLLYVCCAFLLGVLSVFTAFPHIIERCMQWFLYFVFGRYIAADEQVKKMVNRIVEKKILYLECAVFILLVITRLNIKNIGVWGALIEFCIKNAVGFAGVWLIYGISVILSSGRLASIMKLIGDYSYDIYLIHNPYIVAFAATILSKRMHMNSCVAILAATLLGILIPMAVSKYIIRKVPIFRSIMLGK